MKNLIRRAILAVALIAGIVPAFAAAPPPVPALPDTERRTSYSITASTCACAVNMALYGDSTDYQNWVEVFINGVRANYNDPLVGWTITSPTGPIATIPRPITDGVLTFNIAQTGTVQIVGARRPRRVSQFSENAGVSARNLNQTVTDIIAMLREDWDKINDVTGRVPLAPPGETLALLPKLSSRASMNACFDLSGNLTSCVGPLPGAFIAGSGVTFTGANPTTVSVATFTPGSGIGFSGSNPTTISATTVYQPGNGITFTGTNPTTVSSNSHPAFGPVAAPWPNALGDSLFTNAHVTTALPTLVANAMGWASINTSAVSGATIADQASIYGWQMTASVANPALVWLGTNDVILDNDNRTTEQTSLEGYRATLFHFAIPPAKLVTGQAMTVASGTWSNMGASIDPGGTTTNSNGAVKRAILTGRHIVVAGWANLSSTGTATITIGNNNNSANLVNDILTFKRPTILTNSPGGIPTQVVPFVRVYKNVGIDDNSKLTVSVGVTSASGAGNDVFISYVAGLTGNPAEAMPLVIPFKLHNFTLAGETSQGTSATRRERFVRGMSNIYDEMNGLGLWVVPVDAASTLWDTSLLVSDGIHPGDSGNMALTTEAVAAINAATNYWVRRNSELNAGGFDDTLGSFLFPKARVVFDDFRRTVKARAAVGSGFAANNNGVNQVISNNSTLTLSWSTKLYDVNGDFSSSIWSPPAGQVSIRAAATFTAGVDQTPYDLYVYKNGSAYKRIGRTVASGTGELQVSGEMYDLAADGDSYTIVAFQLSGGNATIDGTISKTYFTGMSAY